MNRYSHFIFSSLPLYLFSPLLFIYFLPSTFCTTDQYVLAGITDGTSVQFKIPSGRKIITFSEQGQSVPPNLCIWRCSTPLFSSSFTYYNSVLFTHFSPYPNYSLFIWGGYMRNYRRFQQDCCEWRYVYRDMWRCSTPLFSSSFTSPNYPLNYLTTLFYILISTRDLYFRWIRVE